MLLVLFMFTVANVITLHQTYSFSLPMLQCEDTSAETKIQKAVSVVLKETESCALTSPCVASPSLKCQEETTYGRYIIGSYISHDLMLDRVFPALTPFGVKGYKGSIDFNSGNAPSLTLILYVYSVLLIAALAAMIALWRQSLLHQTFAFPTADRLRVLFYPVLMALTYVLGMYFISTILEQISPWKEPEIEGFFDLFDTPTILLLVVVLAPLVEELLFRGVLLRFFVERARPILGAVLISTIFASFHWFIEVDLVWQIFRMASYFFVSLILCWLYIKNKTIWSPIFFHSAYNGVLVSIEWLIK
ncbi:MAG: CPBP family intramembrane metalloprotease [Xanthomonadales bacterium]|nr:CPBP family intramembrane metalloprotease [Xanthomonadales bacterium]